MRLTRSWSETDWLGFERFPHGIGQPIRFQGQQLDVETGLHYNRFRYYDPALGQYLTQDPIGLTGGWNSFSYVKSPTTHIDPYGLTDISTPEVANQDGRGSSINKIIGAKKGGDRIANGVRKMEGANKKEEEVLDCLMAGPTCKKSTDELEAMTDSAKRERIRGIKEIGQGSVEVYKGTPGTLGNGIPGGRIPKP